MPAKKKARYENLLDKLEQQNAYFSLELTADRRSKRPLVPPSAIIRNVRPTADEIAKRNERRQRFEAESKAINASLQQPTLVEARIQKQGRVVTGQNRNVEKSFLRLTSHPSIADVRPPKVLANAFDLVKTRWKQGDGEYKYVCEQLKSIRQDLVVQHIQDAFTINVYEVHARIAIEVGDWAEFRQCHAVLQQLYHSGDSTKGGCWAEFAAYGLLLSAASGIKVYSHELKQLASRHPGSFAQESMIAHALEACKAYTSNNYIGFFRLYESATKMTPYLMDLLLENMRPRIYASVLAAYMPTLPIPTLGTWLGYDSKKKAVAFIKSRGGQRTADKKHLDIKESRIKHHT